MFLIYLNQAGINAKGFYGLTSLGNPGIGLASDMTGTHTMLSEPCLPPTPGMAPSSFVHLGFILRFNVGAGGWSCTSLPASLFSAGN